MPFIAMLFVSTLYLGTLLANRRAAEVKEALDRINKVGFVAYTKK